MSSPAPQPSTNGLHVHGTSEIPPEVQQALDTMKDEISDVKKFTVEARLLLRVGAWAIPLLASAIGGMVWQFWAMHGQAQAQQEQISAVQQALYEHEHDPAQQQLVNIVGDLRAEVAALQESVDILKRVSLDLARDRDR